MPGWLKRRNTKRQVKKGPSVTHVLPKGTIARIAKEIRGSECVVLLLTEIGQFDHDPVLRKQMELGIEYKKPVILLALSNDGTVAVPDELGKYTQYQGHVLHNGSKEDVKEKFYGIMQSWNEGKRNFP
ncbi:hypothetical protein [Sulfuricurvum sp.]|uniref:hypothetical protein n=1 Tax=Sulfuricurvum sp. TaxID=2025608 RepID=UPI003568C566